MKAPKKEMPFAGIVDGLPIDEYHAHEALSNSLIAHLLRSPAHLVAHLNQPPPSTDSQSLGQAAHAAILEPRKFFAEYVRLPEGNDRRTKTGKAAYDDVVASGKIPLRYDDFVRVEKMIDAVYSHPTASALFSKGKAEQSVFWRDSETKVDCRSRPDYLRPDGVIVDLKVTEITADCEGFQRHAVKYGCFRQAAFGMDGLKTVLGAEQVGWVNVVVEAFEPFAIGVYVHDDAAISYGRNQYRRALSLYAQCMLDEHWPAYPENAQTISLPRWLND